MSRRQLFTHSVEYLHHRFCHQSCMNRVEYLKLEQLVFLAKGLLYNRLDRIIHAGGIDVADGALVAGHHFLYIVIAVSNLRR